MSEPLITPVTRALVTGGGGFLGYKITLQLLTKGYEVTTFSRKKYPKLEKLGTKHIIGDITVYEDINEACKNQDIIFHTVAIAGVNGSYQSYYDINYGGTKNVVNAAINNKVKKLIYTSSPSVAYNIKDVCGADESIGYPNSYLSHYPTTKALAEKLILAQDQETLLTCAIRPHLIWGEDDNHLIPMLVKAASQKSIKQVGNGNNLVDITYVDNAAYAHILAAEKLTNKNSAVAGQAYFISDDNPVNLWQWINDLLSQLEEPLITSKISFPLAYTIGYILEIIQKLTSYPRELKMNRFIAFQLAKSHYFSQKKAKKHFDYQPIISSEEGLKRTKEWWIKEKK